MTVRPIPMRPSVLPTLAVLTAVGLAGCGQQVASDGGTTPGAGQVAPAQWRDCTVAAHEDAPGPAVQVPTGAGTAEVKLPETGPCQGGLVARLPVGVLGLDVRGLDLDPASVQVVDLGGDAEPAALVRVDGGAHPRGGFQPHLFVVGKTVDEVTTAGGPLLPFVATDGGMAPMTAGCTADGGVAVLTARTAEPPGVVLAWDVQRTTYEITGAEAVRTGVEQVHSDVADPALRDRMPALFEPGRLFADC